MLLSLRASNPISPPASTEVREWVATNFIISHMSIHGPPALRRGYFRIAGYLQRTGTERLVSPALQTRQLLGQAILTYALQPLVPTFVLVSRVNFLPSERTVDLMILVLKHFSASKDEVVSILASALVVVTYSPGMHSMHTFVSRRDC